MYHLLKITTMKRLAITLIAVVAMLANANAMSYSQARDQALFLTDKMAYELWLTDDQYNAAYEINLDYIMNVEVAGDLYGVYWNRRNTELQYVLTAAQYSRFISMDYFYRPITYTSNKFRFVIYDRYPNKNHYYRAAPPGYQTYKGGNRYYDNSPYKGRTYDYRQGANNHSGGNGKPGGTGKPGDNKKPGGNGKPGGNDKPNNGNVKPGNYGHNGNGSHNGNNNPMTKKQAVNQGKANMNSRRH